jgi:hypothetical protein
MGRDARTGDPKYIEHGQHLMVTGKTGSGKSSLIGDRLITWMTRSDMTFLVINGGGDPRMFNFALMSCAAAGREMILLSDRPELRNSKIDPFRAAGPMSLSDAVNLLISIAGLDSSKSYGVFYFYIAAVQGVLVVWREMERRGIPIGLETTIDFLNRQRGRRGIVRTRDTEQLQYVISVLLEFRHVIQIDLDPSELGFVRWREIEESGTVVFVSLDVMNPTSALFGASILESFTAYKRACTVRGENDFDAAVLIDEFQRLVSQQLAEGLAGMRKHRTFFYLLAQHIAQIRQVSDQLAETLLAQIGVQIFMSPETEEEQKYIQQFSEEVIRTLGSKTRSLLNPTTGEREVRERRLTINEIRAVAMTPNCAVLINRTKRGVEEPTLLYLEHLVTSEVHEYLSGRPIPRKIPPPAVPELEPAPQAVPAPQDDGHRMREIFERVNAWLAGN